MTNGAPGRELSALEFDVLTEHLGVAAVPLVLRVHSPGRTHRERAELVDSVWRGLAERNLAGRNPGSRNLDSRSLDSRSLDSRSLNDSGSRELNRGLARLLRLLDHPTSEVDGRLWCGRSVRVFAGARGEDGVLVTKDGDTLRVRRATAAGLAREAISVLPPAPAGPGRSVAVRSADLDAAAAETGGDVEALEQELRRRGVRADDAEDLTAMVREAGSRGQFGAAARDGNGKRMRAERVVAFFDTPHGRYAQLRRDSPSGDPWSTIAPADDRRMIALLEELHGELTGPADGFE